MFHIYITYARGFEISTVKLSMTRIYREFWNFGHAMIDNKKIYEQVVNHTDSLRFKNK